MEPAVTWTRASPLRQHIQECVERILACWETGDAAAQGHPARQAIQRFLDALDELSDAAEALVSPPGGRAAEASRSGARVLLVGSDLSFGFRVRDAIGANEGIEVVASKEALSAAAARRVDLVVGYDTAAIDVVRELHDISPAVPALLVVPAAALPDTARAFAAEPVVLLRDPVSPDELAQAIGGLLAIARDRRRIHVDETAGAILDAYGEPRSYAHLAGLLPRALERSIAFDASATVITRAEGEPILELYAVSDVADETLRALGEHALALCRDAAVARKPDPGIVHDGAPLRSILRAYLETNRRIVGVVLLAASRANAFSPDEERFVEAVAGRASAAYRRLEASLTRLRLTPRQSQVLSLIASGHSDKEIAARLGVSHRTVRTHLDRLLREHGLHSRTEAVAAWLRSQQG